MTKKEVTTILCRASKEEVNKIANDIQNRYPVSILKEPKKTLVMVKVRESIKRSLFYLGEVLASECMVFIKENKGVGLIAGDDFEKVLAMAIIDGAINAGLEGEFSLYQQLGELEKAQVKSRGFKNAQILKSKVNFNVMGE